MATRTRPASFGMVITFATAAALASCTGGSGPTPTTTTSGSSGPGTTTSTPTSSESSSDSAVAATEAVTRWWASVDKVSQDSTVPISDLLKVSRGAAYQTWAQRAQAQRAKGWHQVGDTVLVTQSATKIADVEANPKMSVQVCYDVSKVNMIDAAGRSVVLAERAPRAKATYVVANYGDGWFVVNDETRGAPC